MRGGIFLSIAGIFLGAIFAVLFLLLLPFLPLNVENNVYKLFGIHKARIIGFQPYWLLGKASADSNNVTTLTYFGLSIGTDGTIQKLTNPQEEEPGWTTVKSKKLQQTLQAAKNRQTTLSLLLGDSDESSIALLMQSPQQHAQNLVKDVTPLMKKYGFTDLNLDIESFLEASSSSRQHFITFLKTVRNGMETNHLGTLTVEISPTVLVKKFLIDPQALGKIADYVVLMAYDYHYLGSYISGPVAPIDGAGQVTEFDLTTAIKEATKVIPAQKLLLGIPLYGYEWETMSNQPGAATIPGGGSTASNKRVMQFLSTCSNCRKSIDSFSQEPIVIFPDPHVADDYHQIFYEDATALRKKIDLANTYHLGGIALWALGYEGNEMLQPLEKYKQQNTNF